MVGQHVISVLLSCTDTPFKLVEQCCQRKCYDVFNENSQEEIYARYIKCTSKESQDLFLSSCMKWDVATTQKTNPKRSRAKTWMYTIVYDNSIEVKVCKTCFMKLFQVSRKRIEVIQKKLVSGSGFEEKRGKYQNRRRIVTDELKALMNAHLLSIPHRKSHYTKSKMLYFERSDLTIKKLYMLFRVFYRKKKDEALQLTLKKYYQLFQNLNFAIRQPKTDICDECEKYKIHLRRNPSDNRVRVMKGIHERKVKKYKRMKRELLSNIPQDTMVLEFDYGQNLPLPKLAINKQFYKRLLWFNVLNIHCHNDKTSTFYTFMENEAKKDANSIASFIYDFLTYKGVIADGQSTKHRLMLMSDNAGGQNKNMTMIRFCAWLSAKYGLEIEHWFPIRGHSFCVCDRNFGLYGRQIKKRCPITSHEEYLDIMRQCRLRPEPFRVVNDHTRILDYTRMFNESGAFLPKSNGFKIRSYQRFFFCNGVLSASRTLNRHISQPFKIMSRRNVHLEEMRPEEPSLNRKKASDILDLLSYMISVVFFQKLTESFHKIAIITHFDDLGNIFTKKFILIINSTSCLSIKKSTSDNSYWKK